MTIPTGGPHHALLRLGLAWFRIRARWQTLSKRNRRFLTGALVGIAIDLALQGFQGSKALGSLEDLSIDWMIRMHAGTSPAEGRPFLPFTVLDIDNKTYELWGEPLVLPRDKLLQLVRFAVERHASLVVVDIDLSRPTSQDADQQLVQYLATRSTANTGTAKMTPLIFVRSFRTPLVSAQTLTPRPSLLDEITNRSSDLYFAAPLFELDTDFLVRRWRLWEPTCGHKSGDIVPSIQLLALGLHDRPSTGSGPLREVLSTLGDYACRYRIPTVGDPKHASTQTKVQLGHVRLTIDPDYLERRILFTIPWRIMPPGTARPVVTLNGSPVPLIVELPAHVVVDSPQNVSSDAISGRVVLIGGSFADGRDVYGTPIGPMPGVFIIMNAIHSLVQYGELRPPPALPALLFGLSMILATSALCARLNSFAGTLASGALIVFILLPASFWLFRAGVWLEFAVPIVGVLIDHLCHQLSELVPFRKAHTHS